jgi:hypothetical protein
VQDVAVKPFIYTDGVVTLRRQHPDDLEMHLAGVDEEQMAWLWEPGDRELYGRMTPDEQRAHQLQHLRASHDSFGPGPKWAFSARNINSLRVARAVGAREKCSFVNESGATMIRHVLDLRPVERPLR